MLCLLIIVILLVLLCLARRYGMPEKCKSLINKVKSKIFWNLMIRYLFLNALKLNMTGLVAIKTATEAGVNLAIGVGTLSVINMVPLVFVCFLYNNQDELESEALVKSAGTLMLGKYVIPGDHQVWMHPIIFFYRRSLYIVVTVYLLDYPAL